MSCFSSMSRFLRLGALSLSVGLAMVWTGPLHAEEVNSKRPQKSQQKGIDPEKKAQILSHIQQKKKNLQAFQDCVTAAKERSAMKNCHEMRKKHNQAAKAQRQQLKQQNKARRSERRAAQRMPEKNYQQASR